MFHSDFGTALGTTDDAMFDTSKPVPWDGFIGNGRANEVVPSTGLDFPSANVLAVNAAWRESPAGAPAQNHTLFTENAHIPVPAPGGDLFYRWYIRVTVPDSYTADPSTHPIEDSPGTGTQNWNFVVTTSSDGTWELRFQTGASDWPNHRWSPPPLDKNETYRVEMQIHRLDDTRFNLHARIYDSADALLYDDDDFMNANGSASLASNPVQTIVDWATMAGFQAGFNGLAGGTADQFPFTVYYQGCFAISDTDWLGPYRSGV